MSRKCCGLSEIQAGCVQTHSGDLAFLAQEPCCIRAKTRKMQVSRIARLVRSEVFPFVRPKLFPAGSDQDDGPFGNGSVNFLPLQKILYGDQVIGMPLGFVTHI